MLKMQAGGQCDILADLHTPVVKNKAYRKLYHDLAGNVVAEFPTNTYSKTGLCCGGLSNAAIQTHNQRMFSNKAYLSPLQCPQEDAAGMIFLNRHPFGKLFC